MYAVYQFNSNGVGTYSFLSNINNDNMQSFTSLSCGKSYFIVLKQGTNFIEIPNFVYSSFSEVGENYLSKECKTNDESFAPIEDGETEEDTNSPTTKKILALHGGGGSSYGLQSQKGVSDLVSSLSDVEFVFADAPNNLSLIHI